VHFNPIDLNYDSPGCLLINIQFVVESSTTKRVLKEKGLDKKFILYAHIIQGFDLDPTNKNNTTNDYSVEVFMDSNSITNKKDIINFTKYVPEDKTKIIMGAFPLYNEVISIDTDLDLKLDFAPDVVVRLLNNNEEIGNFTVPIRSIKKKNENDYPHYFNFIKNNQIVGRLLAMFYITSKPQKKNKTESDKLNESEKKSLFKLYEKLSIQKSATIKVYLHGLRNLDFNSTFQNCKFSVKIGSNCNKDKNINVNLLTSENSKNEDNDVSKSIKYIDPKSIEQVNDEQKNNYINICQVLEFKTFVHGDPKGLETNDDDDVNLTLFPMIEFKVVNSSFFGNTERFLIMNLSEFYPGFSEKTKLKYQNIFENNLYVKNIDQEQKLINYKNTKRKKKGDEAENRNLDEEEEINEEERLLFRKEKPVNKNEKSKDDKNKAAAPIEKIVTQKEINDFIIKYEKFDIHKFLDIINEDCLCLKEDKDKEREAKRKIIKSTKKELDELRKKEEVKIFYKKSI